MDKFTGSKWYCKDTILVRDYDNFEEVAYKEKPIFAMTRDYRKYLHDKKLEEQRNELIALKAKLEYQLQHYGEYDEIDLLEYKYKKELYKA